MAIRAAQGAVFQRLHSPHSDFPAEVELVLYHDVLCSWCYLADARLDYLRDEWPRRSGTAGLPAGGMGGGGRAKGSGERHEHGQVTRKYVRGGVAPAEVGAVR